MRIQLKNNHHLVDCCVVWANKLIEQANLTSAYGAVPDEAERLAMYSDVDNAYVTHKTRAYLLLRQCAYMTLQGQKSSYSSVDIAIYAASTAISIGLYAEAKVMCNMALLGDTDDETRYQIDSLLKIVNTW